MDRQTLMKIMAALPESEMVKALSVAGVNVGGGAGAPGGMVGDFAADGDASNMIEPWNDTMIKAPGRDTPRPPIFSGQNFIEQEALDTMAMGGGQVSQPAPYLDPGYEEDDDLRWLALQQSGGMA